MTNKGIIINDTCELERRVKILEEKVEILRIYGSVGSSGGSGGPDSVVYSVPLSGNEERV